MQIKIQIKIETRGVNVEQEACFQYRLEKNHFTFAFDDESETSCLTMNRKHLVRR